jgi:hypothetical protein
VRWCLSVGIDEGDKLSCGYFSAFLPSGGRASLTFISNFGSPVASYLGSIVRAVIINYNDLILAGIVLLPYRLQT